MSFTSVPSDGLPDLFQGSTVSSTSSRPREFPAPMPDTGRSGSSSISRSSQLRSSRSDVGVRQARRQPATRPPHGLEDDSEFQPSGLRHWGIPVHEPRQSAWDSVQDGDGSMPGSRHDRLPTLGRTIGAQGSLDSIRDAPWLADGDDDDARDSRNTTFSIMSTYRSGNRSRAPGHGVTPQTVAPFPHVPVGRASGLARPEGSQFSPRTAAVNEEWGWKWGEESAAAAGSTNTTKPNAYSNRRPSGDHFTRDLRKLSAALGESPYNTVHHDRPNGKTAPKPPPYGGTAAPYKSALTPIPGSPGRVGPQAGATLPVKGPSSSVRVFGPRNIPIVTAEDEEEAKQFQDHLSDASFFASATDEATAAEQDLPHGTTSQASPTGSTRRLKSSLGKYNLSLEGSATKKHRVADPPLFMREAYPKDRIQTVVSQKLDEPVPVDNNRVMLTDNPALTCSLLRSVALLNTDKVKYADLSGSNVDDVMIASFLAAADSLATLVVSRCGKLTSVFVRTVAQKCSTTLTSINVSFNPKITSEGLAWLAGGVGRTCPPCKGLRTLNCQACPKINTDAFRYLSYVCWNLRYLSLRDNDQISSSGLCDLLRKSRYLRVLDIGRCGLMTDDVLFALAEGCPKLRSLSISKNAVMTDAGMIAVAERCPELHRLKMDETKLHSESILALTKNCTSLQLLDCSGCDNIPENTIKAAALALPFAEMAKLFFGLKPKRNRVDVYYKTRVDTIQNHSAAQIQKYVRGRIARRKFRQVVLDRVQATREAKANARLVRWYRHHLIFKGLTQRELERMKMIEVNKKLMMRRFRRGFELLARKAKEKAHRNALSKVVPIIQASWRGWFVRNRTHPWIYGQIAAQREVVHRTKMGLYAIELQRLFRGYKGRIVAKVEKGELPHLRLRDIAAAKYIQAAVRRYLFRLLAWRVRQRRAKRRREFWLRKWKRGLYLPWIPEHNQPALTITQAMRRALQCLAVKRTLPALRRHRERRLGAAIIQRAWRLHRDWWNFKNYYLRRKAAATRIQALFRRTRVTRWREVRRQKWESNLKKKVIEEAHTAIRGKDHTRKIWKKRRELDSASSESSASWSESESDPQVPKDLVFAVLNMNPLTRMGRRKRNKVQTHAEYDWYKTRGGQAWLDKLSVHDNSNWSSHQSKTKTNKTGGAYPPDTNPGVSNIPINKGDKFPVVPPLPVSSKYAPDGSDEWDGELEAVDNDKDGYFTGRSLHAEKSPSPRERLTLAQLSDRSGIADLASMRLLNKLRKDGMFKGGIGNRAAFDSMERLRQRRRTARARRQAQEKRTDWEYEEKRGHERRARQRRKYRREKLLAQEEKAATAKAMGQAVISSDEGSSAEFSSDFERKGVTVPQRYLQLDYGYPADHPINRGGAPSKDDIPSIVKMVKKKWAKFGVERPKKSWFNMKVAKPVMVKKYPYGKGGPIRGTLMAGSLPSNVTEHNEDPGVDVERKAFYETLNRDSTRDMWNAAIVGARVKVYWEREHSWHPGRIIKYNAKKGRHKIRYEDEDTEWLDIGRHSNRVLVDDKILRITDTMKRHLGIPLDGYRSATTDVVVARYRPVTPPERRYAKVAKPWIPPWEREEAARTRQEEEDKRVAAETEAAQKAYEASLIHATLGGWKPMSFVKPPCDEDVVKKGRRASAIARLYITAKMREYYNRQDQRQKFGGNRHSVLRANTIGADAAMAEGVDVDEVVEKTTADSASKGAWQWDDAQGWWWDPEASAEAEQWPPVAEDGNVEGQEEAEPALTFDEFMARKLERERQARQVILEKKVRRHGEGVIREWLHLAPAWTRHLLDQTTDGGQPNGGDPVYYWSNEATGQSVWEMDMLVSASLKLTNEEVVDSEVPEEPEPEEESLSSQSSSVADHRYSTGSEDERSEFSSDSGGGTDEESDPSVRPSTAGNSGYGGGGSFVGKPRVRVDDDGGDGNSSVSPTPQAFGKFAALNTQRRGSGSFGKGFGSKRAMGASNIG